MNVNTVEQQYTSLINVIADFILARHKLDENTEPPKYFSQFAENIPTDVWKDIITIINTKAKSLPKYSKKRNKLLTLVGKKKNETERVTSN